MHEVNHRLLGWHPAGTRINRDRVTIGTLELSWDVGKSDRCIYGRSGESDTRRALSTGSRHLAVKPHSLGVAYIHIFKSRAPLLTLDQGEVVVLYAFWSRFYCFNQEFMRLVHVKIWNISDKECPEARLRYTLQFSISRCVDPGSYGKLRMQLQPVRWDSWICGCEWLNCPWTYDNHMTRGSINALTISGPSLVAPLLADELAKLDSTSAHCICTPTLSCSWSWQVFKIHFVLGKIVKGVRDVRDVRNGRDDSICLLKLPERLLIYFTIITQKPTPSNQSTQRELLTPVRQTHCS